MPRTFFSILLLSILLLTGCFSTKTSNKKAESVLSNQKTDSVLSNEKADSVLIFLVFKLNSMKYTPLKNVDWHHDYGFKDGWLRNKFYYLRSIVSYADINKLFGQKVFLKGPHSEKMLNLDDSESFGYYNKDFLLLVKASIDRIVSNKNFLNKSRGIIQKFGIIDSLKSMREIHNIYIKDENGTSSSIKKEYMQKIVKGNWPVGGYREYIPKSIGQDYYNWGETTFHFWLRRDIDGTKEIWFSIINKIINAYESLK